jgi:hypothetical protein
MYVSLTISHTQQAVLYTLSRQLVSAQNASHYQAANKNSKNGNLSISRNGALHYTKTTKIPSVYGTQMFKTVCLLLAFSWATWIQFKTLQPLSFRSILILLSQLLLSLQIGLVSWGFRTKTLYVYLVYLILATCAVHFISIDFMVIFYED